MAARADLSRAIDDSIERTGFEAMPEEFLWGGFMRSARLIAERGVFTFPNAASGKELNAFFDLASDPKRPAEAEVIGQVEYRNGEGPLLVIRPGPVQVEFSPGDAVLTWPDGSWRSEAAMPFVNFCRYVSDGAILLRR